SGILPTRCTPRKFRNYSRKGPGSRRPSRVIIDMDGGIDDALALILALRSPELEVAGITAVTGNVPVEQATINGLRVVELLDGSDVWVENGFGNETPVAEFNVYSDPEAAKIVFEAEVPVKAVGLDVTMNPRVQLTKSDYDWLRNRKGRVSAFASSILKNNMRRYGRFALHD